MGLPTELLVLGHTNIKWMRFAGSTWKTNDKKAFVDKLLKNTDPKREQYETEARQSLFNMVQKDLRSASNSPSIFLFYRDSSTGSAETFFFTGRPMTKLGVGKLLISALHLLFHSWPFSIF